MPCVDATSFLARLLSGSGGGVVQQMFSAELSEPWFEDKN